MSVCVFVCCAHVLPHMYLCASEGVSLEEQVRRIKDIEAIESDSFVPQAFKSSRDDTKVRFLPLSLSLAIPISYWICPAAMPPSVQRQPRPNQTLIQALAVCFFPPNPETVSSDAQLLSALPERQHPHKSNGEASATAAVLLFPPTPPPTSLLARADADKIQKSLMERLQRSEDSICRGPRAVFWKEARQHATSETRADNSWLRVPPSTTNVRAHEAAASSTLRHKVYSAPFYTFRQEVNRIPPSTWAKKPPSFTQITRMTNVPVAPFPV